MQILSKLGVFYIVVVEIFFATSSRFFILLKNFQKYRHWKWAHIIHMVLQICKLIISSCDFHLNNFQLQSYKLLYDLSNVMLHVFIKSHLVSFFDFKS
jgi:5-methylcytosine-specific restriction endonuclease McrBC regulatory subunit McrC